MVLSRVFCCFIGFFLVFQAAPSWAAFLFCNQTPYAIEAAFAYRDDGYWASEGWWQIQPKQCARVYDKELTQRFYFYHARALGTSPEETENAKVWGGKHEFCTDRKAFRIAGDSRCELRGYKTKGFKNIDIGARRKEYTLTFR